MDLYNRGFKVFKADLQSVEAKGFSLEMGVNLCHEFSQGLRGHIHGH
jgi:hypothetical protein